MSIFFDVCVIDFQGIRRLVVIFCRLFNLSGFRVIGIALKAVYKQAGASPDIISTIACVFSAYP
jgi:hypothetical protein